MHAPVQTILATICTEPQLELGPGLVRGHVTPDEH